MMKRPDLKRSDLMLFVWPAFTGLMFMVLVAVIVVSNVYAVPLGATVTIGILAGVGFLQGAILSI